MNSEHPQWFHIYARKDRDVICVFDREAAEAAVIVLQTALMSGLSASRGMLIQSVIGDILEQLGE